MADKLEFKEKEMKGKDVLYNGQELTLMKYFGNTCLFIKKSSQIHVPKMQFVGGYPNEYCIYIKDLTESEKKMITDLKGNPLDIEEEIRKI